MECSRELSPNWGLASAIVLVGVVARLAIPVSLWTLTSGSGRLAAGAAISVSALGVVRSVLSGHLARKREGRRWRDVVHALRRTSVAELGARADDEQAFRIVDALHELVEFEAVTAPRVTADLLALVILGVWGVFTLGPAWLMVGLGGILVVALLLMPAQRAIRVAQVAAHNYLGKVGADLDVLLRAPAELRVHGREEAIADQLLHHAALAAGERRRVHLRSALSGLVPIGLILLGATVPTMLDSGALADPDTMTRVGILGGSGLVYAVGVARGFEANARATPHRNLLESLHRRPSEAFSPAGPADVMPVELVELVGVTVRHDGADRSTPDGFSFSWPDRTGLALVGGNGSGKTTLLHAVLGLTACTSGAIHLDGEPADAALFAALRRRTIYLPQAPYVAGERTVGWHLRLVCPSGVSDQALEVALRSVALWSVLEGRHRAPLEVLAGSLSGGELRRLALARLFVPWPEPPFFYLLDEPEAGLDHAARVWLRNHLETLSRSGRVMLTAHDPTVIPETFSTQRTG